MRFPPEYTLLFFTCKNSVRKIDEQFLAGDLNVMCALHQDKVAYNVISLIYKDRKWENNSQGQ